MFFVHLGSGGSVHCRGITPCNIGMGNLQNQAVDGCWQPIRNVYKVPEPGLRPPLHQRGGLVLYFHRHAATQNNTGRPSHELSGRIFCPADKAWMFESASDFLWTSVKSTLGKLPAVLQHPASQYPGERRLYSQRQQTLAARRGDCKGVSVAWYPELLLSWGSIILLTFTVIMWRSSLYCASCIDFAIFLQNQCCVSWIFAKKW